MTTTPEGLNPAIQTRELLFEADVRSVTPFLKVATVTRNGTDPMTFACDGHRADSPHRGAAFDQPALAPSAVRARW